MQDLQIKIVSNGWIVTTRNGTQLVYTKPIDLIEAIALKALSMEERKSITIKQIYDQR